MANTYKMTDRDIQQLILLRASNAAIFTGRKNSAMRGWRAIKREMGLQGLMSARQLKKKWDNLNQKYKVIKNPPEGEKPKNPRSWPWYFLMDDAISGRLDNAAKVIQPLPIDDEKQEADLPLRPPSDSEEILSALNVVEMAPIEHEEDVEMIDKCGNYEEAKRPDDSPQQAPKITIKTLESVPSMPKTVPTKTQQQNTQPPVLYATLLPDSTASVASNGPPTSSSSIVMQAETVTNNNANNTDTQNVQPTTLLYATLLPDSTATSATKSCMASSQNVALELAELHKKLAELKKEKRTLEKEQAAFDKELINLESEREQLSRDRQTLDLERIEIERVRAVVDKNKADLEREKAGVERDRLLLDRDRAYLDRDRAIFERDKVFLDKAKDDFERQKEQLRNPKIIAFTGAAEEDLEAVTEEERMDVSEKCDDLTNKVIQILTSEAEQKETRQRFATLVQRLVEKL